MGHLLSETGGMIGQNDGLGVPPVIWQPGDIIVQRHRFPAVPDQKRVWLRTGLIGWTLWSGGRLQSDPRRMCCGFR
ncbi:MAG: hypothetical protein NZ769_01545 [Anaerolineae bacterium]|nr:hypothetical protein [Anaerolineae bacterium]